MARKKKQINEMTVKELQDYIRTLTEQANDKLGKIQKNKETRAIAREKDVLTSKGIIGKRGKAVLGFRGKTKLELQAQARELEYFKQWKPYQRTEKKTRKDLAKYKSFIRNNPEFKDYSYSDWRSMVELFGTMSNFIESFGYENIKQLHRETTAGKENVNYVKALQDVAKQHPATKEDAIDLLRMYIGQ